jgi:hypothetical protein
VAGAHARQVADEGVGAREAGAPAADHHLGAHGHGCGEGAEDEPAPLGAPGGGEAEQGEGDPHQAEGHVPEDLARVQAGVEGGDRLAPERVVRVGQPEGDQIGDGVLLLHPRVAEQRVAGAGEVDQARGHGGEPDDDGGEAPEES